MKHERKLQQARERESCFLLHALQREETKKDINMEVGDLGASAGAPKASGPSTNRSNPISASSPASMAMASAVGRSGQAGLEGLKPAGEQEAAQPGVRAAAHREA